MSEQTRASYDFGTSKPFLVQAGRYQLRATYYDDYERRAPSSKVASKVVDFEVLAPSNPEAYDAYRGLLAAMIADSGRGVVAGDEIIQNASAFLDRFGDSMYANELRGHLVEHLYFRVYKPDGNLRPGATAKHREMYERYRRAHDDARKAPR